MKIDCYALIADQVRQQPLPANMVAAEPGRPGERWYDLGEVEPDGLRQFLAPLALHPLILDRCLKPGNDPSVVRLVTQNRGRMAIERGPIVYCAEWPDVEGGRVLELLFDRHAEVNPATDRNLSGAVVLHTEAGSIVNPAEPPVKVRLVPYHLWANRGVGEMSVWLSVEGYSPGDAGPAGGFIFYENPNYAADGWRYLEAAPFDQSAGAPWGCFRRAIPGARGTAVGTGRQNTLDMLAACREPGSAAVLCADLIVNGVRGWFLPSRDELVLKLIL